MIVMKNRYLLDTNIIIHLMHQHPKVVKAVHALNADDFLISSISYLETMLGIPKETKKKADIELFLEDLEVVPFDKTATLLAGELNLASPKKLKFKDLMIAATALAQDLPLVTADKDFNSIKGLKVKYVKI